MCGYKDLARTEVSKVQQDSRFTHLDAPGAQQPDHQAWTQTVVVVENDEVGAGFGILSKSAKPKNLDFSRGQKTS